MKSVLFHETGARSHLFMFILCVFVVCMDRIMAYNPPFGPFETHGKAASALRGTSALKKVVRTALQYECRALVFLL